MKSEGELIIYKSKSGDVEIKATFRDDTIWLNQNQMADLFGVNRQAITKHLNNIFKSKELEENSVCSILEHTAEDNKSYKTKFYNLDSVISVGYRVNSQKATDFRIWATKTLKQYLVNGYIINDKKFKEVQSIIQFITAKAKIQELSGHEKEILDVIERYSKTWKVLGEYDEGDIKIEKFKKSKYQLNYYKSRQIIDELKEDLLKKKIVGDLFGSERGHTFEGILGNLYQTFGGEELYGSLEEKAAHLIYFVIKDHPFSDGNKRIGSLLFLHFLNENSFLFKNNGEVKISDRTLVALALLVASSNPREKESIVRLIINLIQD
ncbi:MAG: virulence protein RhuM/Fic/DOC family protein [Patescibacteria group bacterium]|nr:virulence protein RhuM/Fic/DOC family protein [Patescibacteria group bacterium]